MSWVFFFNRVPLKFSFPKEQRLKSRKIIDQLFQDGKVIAAHPLRALWVATALPEDVSIQYGVAVSKRNFKRAVDRNAIKRKMREAIRLHKHVLEDSVGMKNGSLAFMVIYTGKEIVDYHIIEEQMIRIFDRLKQAL